ncbi:MAG: PaaI family thioesterase [Burkholderiaceae bacterium]|nr:PaaI family thioesterase [Burkholderiaceae bacterium]
METQPTRWTLEYWNHQLYVDWVGARMVSLERGVSRIQLLVGEHHRGGAGTSAVNGAILAYLHDILQGAAVGTLVQPNRAIATLNLNISYLSLASVEHVLHGEGRVVRHGSAVAYAESEFRSEQGEVCCKATGTFRIFRARPEA